MNKAVKAIIAALGIACAGSTVAYAQNPDIHANSLIVDNGTTLHNTTINGTVTIPHPNSSTDNLTLTETVGYDANNVPKYNWTINCTDNFSIFSKSIYFDIRERSEMDFDNGLSMQFEDHVNYPNGDPKGVFYAAPPCAGETTEYNMFMLSAGSSFIWGDTGACLVGDLTSPYAGNNTGARLVAFRHNSSFLHNFYNNNNNEAERAIVSVKTVPGGSATPQDPDYQSDSSMTTRDKNNVEGTTFYGSTVGPAPGQNNKESIVIAGTQDNNGDYAAAFAAEYRQAGDTTGDITLKKKATLATTDATGGLAASLELSTHNDNNGKAKLSTRSGASIELTDNGGIVMTLGNN